MFEFEINNSGKYSDKTEVKADILIVRIINFDKAEQIHIPPSYIGKIHLKVF